MGDNGAITISEIYCFVRGNMSVQEKIGECSGEMQLCAYDMTSGEIRVLATYQDSILPMYGYDRYIYYSVAVYSETDEGIKNSYALCHADVESGKLIEIPFECEYSTASSISTADFPSVYTIDDDRIYWYAPSSDGYVHYTTDLVGKTPRAADSKLPYHERHIL